jgi:SnoaL-like domain
MVNECHGLAEEKGVGMGEQETALDVAQRYLGALAAGDGELAASLFTADGVIDDGLGRHWEGRDEIRGFISTPRSLVVDAPSHVFSKGDRVIAYGHLTLPDDHVTYELLRPQQGDGRVKFRWVFHFKDSLISHLSNSFLKFIPETAEPVA